MRLCLCVCVCAIQSLNSAFIGSEQSLQIAPQQRLNRVYIASIEPLQKRRNRALIAESFNSQSETCFNSPFLPLHAPSLSRHQPPHKQKGKRHMQQYEDTYSSLRTHLYNGKFSDIQRRLEKRKKTHIVSMRTHTHTQISLEYIYIYAYIYMRVYTYNIYIYNECGLNRASEQRLNRAFIYIVPCMWIKLYYT